MTYPIIQFFLKDKNIYGQDSGPARASIGLFDYFKNSIILDAEGYRYKVKSVRRIGWANLWGYHPLMKGRTAIIDYDFSENEQLSLALFKKEVTDRLALGVKRGFWYKKTDIPFLTEKVNRCGDYQSIIECFINDLYS